MIGTKNESLTRPTIISEEVSMETSRCEMEGGAYLRTLEHSGCLHVENINVIE